jgi:hypothetical protein
MKHAVLFAAIAFAVPSLAQKHAEVGQQVPDVTFPTFLNGDGRQKLSEFFGQPVVIDQWGTRCPPCTGTAVPSAIRHDHEHKKDGLVTILVESQGSNAAQHEAFMWKTFPDNDCFACTGTSIPVPPSQGIPYCAVIGVDGKLLWVGNPAATPKPIEELVAAELLKVKKGWGETADHKKVRAALYGKGDLAGAAALVAAMPEGEARTKLQGEIDARYATAKAAISALQGQGNYMAAEARAKDLLKSVGTKAEWVAEVTPLVAAFETPEAKAELAMEKKLDKVVKQLRDRKGDNAPKTLQALLKDGANTKVGERAQRILTALQTPVASD